MGNGRISLVKYRVNVAFERIFGPYRGPRYQNDRLISPITNMKSDKPKNRWFSCLLCSYLKVLTKVLYTVLGHDIGYDIILLLGLLELVFILIYLGLHTQMSIFY